MDAVVRKTDAIKETPQVEVKEQEESSTSNNSSPVPMSSSKMFDKIKKHIELIQRKGYKESNKEEIQHEELVAYFVECNDTHFKTMDEKHVQDLTKEFFRIEKELKFYIERAK